LTVAVGGPVITPPIHRRREPETVLTVHRGEQRLLALHLPLGAGLHVPTAPSQPLDIRLVVLKLLVRGVVASQKLLTGPVVIAPGEVRPAYLREPAGRTAVKG